MVHKIFLALALTAFLLGPSSSTPIEEQLPQVAPTKEPELAKTPIESHPIQQTPTEESKTELRISEVAPKAQEGLAPHVDVAPEEKSDLETANTFWGGYGGYGYRYYPRYYPSYYGGWGGGYGVGYGGYGGGWRRGWGGRGWGGHGWRG